ncbi:MAG: metalloprotease RseP [Bacteroidota bacterium]|jgi:regulator of sigma E protease
MEILIEIVYLIMSLSILVFLHEMGHYLTARMFKIRVDKFYLFFDFMFPLQNVLKFSIFKKKIGDTEWGLGWFPMGGYVQINGMIDESMDKETMAQPEQPWEFRSKPAWQRLIVMLGGVIVNIILGVVIFWFILSKWGDSYLPTANLKYGIYADSIAQQMGLQNGDKILSVDGKKVENFAAIPGQIILNSAKTIQIERDSQQMDIKIPSGIIGKLAKGKKDGFISPRTRFWISDVSSGSNALKAGLEKGDRVIMVNNVKTEYYDEVKATLKKNKETIVPFVIIRNGKELTKQVEITKEGTIGVGLGDTIDLKVKSRSYSVAEAFPAAVDRSITTITNYVKGLNQLFLSIIGRSEVKATDSVGGFASMAKLFPKEWGDWYQFWTITAIISLILAFMNLLPIPALDGGHALFCLYEIIFRRKPSVKFLEYSQYVGMAILLSLMLFANLNDVYKAWFK